MTPDKNILDWILHLWPILGAIFLLIVDAIVMNLRVNRLYDKDGEPNYASKNDLTKAMEWKRALYNEDSTLRYVTQKECEKNMDGIQECIDKDAEDTGKFLLTKDHDQLCEIRLLRFEKAITVVIDSRLKDFGEALLKELRNGNRKET